MAALQYVQVVTGMPAAITQATWLQVFHMGAIVQLKAPNTGAALCTLLQAHFSIPSNSRHTLSLEPHGPQMRQAAL
jgi:hypothetical protein